MPWGAIAGAAGNVLGGVLGGSSQRRAARDAARAAAEATALQRQIYEQSRVDQQPYIQAGHGALSQMGSLNSGDFSSFTESPDYQFARDQGIKALDRSAAARGTQYSGGQLAALADYSGGLASQNYGQYYNRIAQLAGMGQNAASASAGAGQNYANQAGQNMMTGANASAAGRIGAASTYGNLAQQLSGAFGRWYENRPPSTVYAPTTSQQWADTYTNRGSMPTSWAALDPSWGR